MPPLQGYIAETTAKAGPASYPIVTSPLQGCALVALKGQSLVSDSARDSKIN
jgi:hypothetical protein